MKIKINSKYKLSQIKLNYNCPESEKNGVGPGSCSNSENKLSDKNTELKSKVFELHIKRSEGHKIAIEKLNKLFTDNNRFKIAGRLKTPSSIEKKMKARGINDPEKFDDISGLRVVTTNANDTKIAIEKIKTEFKNIIKPGTEDNYIENPKETGYHAYHVTIIIKGEPHEIQVRTERFNKWAETYHDVYKAEDWAKSANTPDTVKYFKDMANIYQKLDEGILSEKVASEIEPPCPSELQNIGRCL